MRCKCAGNRYGRGTPNGRSSIIQKVLPDGRRGYWRGAAHGPAKLTYKPKQCVVCGEEFVPRSSNAKICADPKCKRERNRRDARNTYYRNRDQIRKRQNSYVRLYRALTRNERMEKYKNRTDEEKLKTRNRLALTSRRNREAYHFMEEMFGSREIVNHILDERRSTNG